MQDGSDLCWSVVMLILVDASQCQKSSILPGKVELELCWSGQCWSVRSGIVVLVSTVGQVDAGQCWSEQVCAGQYW